MSYYLVSLPSNLLHPETIVRDINEVVLHRIRRKPKVAKFKQMKIVHRRGYGERAKSYYLVSLPFYFTPDSLSHDINDGSLQRIRRKKKVTYQFSSRWRSCTWTFTRKMSSSWERVWHRFSEV